MPSANTHSKNVPRRGFTLIELLVVIAIVAILSVVALGSGRSVGTAGQIARAKAELGSLAAALESYRRAFGDYPHTGSSEMLLQCLIGKRGPTGGSVRSRVLVDLALIRIESDRDPFVSESVGCVDPWGQLYRYAYKTVSPWSQPGYVLFSSGPDQVWAELLAAGRIDESSPGNLDNIYPGR